MFLVLPEARGASVSSGGRGSAIRLDTHRRPVRQDLRSPLGELCGVVAHADNGVRAEGFGVLNHLDIRLVARLFADLLVFADVASADLLERADEPLPKVERTNHDASNDTEVIDDSMVGDVIACGHEDAAPRFDALAVGTFLAHRLVIPRALAGGRRIRSDGIARARRIRAAGMTCANAAGTCAMRGPVCFGILARACRRRCVRDGYASGGEAASNPSHRCIAVRAISAGDAHRSRGSFGVRCRRE